MMVGKTNWGAVLLCAVLMHPLGTLVSLTILGGWRPKDESDRLAVKSGLVRG